MMKIKQLLDDLKAIVKEAQTIIDVLEKQVPQKPRLDGYGLTPDGSLVVDEWLCPCCNSRYEVDYDEYEYCPNCGQKIAWEELKKWGKP